MPLVRINLRKGAVHARFNDPDMAPCTPSRDAAGLDSVTSAYQTSAPLISMNAFMSKDPLFLNDL
jgi:hypothetical protein